MYDRAFTDRLIEMSINDFLVARVTFFSDIREILSHVPNFSSNVIVIIFALTLCLFDFAYCTILNSSKTPNERQFSRTKSFVLFVQCALAPLMKIYFSLHSSILWWIWTILQNNLRWKIIAQWSDNRNYHYCSTALFCLPPSSPPYFPPSVY